jgi:2-polyprenyl-3-methyl-5-hydroxy-6-metoxy-1,4-benzoquinol methylase
MDAEERLSVEAVRERSLLAAQHVHRYELAARLCAGLRVLDLGCGVGYGADILASGGAAEVEGVDLDEETVREAQGTFGSDRVHFRAADAVGRLRSLDPGEVDAIVCFETLEHLAQHGQAIERMAELAAAGVRLILSVPNSRMFEEENEFHVTDFGHDEAAAAFAPIEGVTMLFQHLAEGSLIAGANAELRGVADGLDEADPEYAHCFIAVAGFAAEDLAAATAHLALVAKPNLNRYMLELVSANAELWRTNHRLMRERLGRSDAAGASVIGRYEREIRSLIQARAERDRRIVELEKVARHNDLMYQRELAWRDATRYHLVDWLRDRLVAIPGLSRVLRSGWRVLRKVSGRG